MWTKLLAPGNSSMPNFKKVLVSEFAFPKTAYILWIIPKAHFCSLTWQNGKYLRSELLSVWSQAKYVTFHTIITGFIVHTFIQDDILLHDLIFFCMIQLICVFFVYCFSWKRLVYITKYCDSVKVASCLVWWYFYGLRVCLFIITFLSTH